MSMLSKTSDLFIVPSCADCDHASDHPLALYVFSTDSSYKCKVFDNTQSGACVANEVVIHPGATGLPFGGIGPSGCMCSAFYRCFSCSPASYSWVPHR